MALTPLFDPSRHARAMRVAAFMSGSGTNIRKLIELQHRLEEEYGESPFQVVLVFSDRSDGACQGERIALEAGIPYISFDIRKFYQKRNLPRTVATPEGMEARKAYDAVARTVVTAFGVDLIALGGYMSYITLPRCVNVHPADLTIRNPDGSRRFVGDHAVRDAIRAGQVELRASTLWTDEGVDTGPLLMVSRPLRVELPCPLEEVRRDEALLNRIADAHQERLKTIGDWEIFPKTILWIAQGRFAMDEHGTVHLDGKPVPDGVRL